LLVERETKKSESTDVANAALAKSDGFDFHVALSMGNVAAELSASPPGFLLQQLVLVSVSTISVDLFTDLVWSVSSLVSG